MNTKKLSLLGLFLGVSRAILNGRFFDKRSAATITTAGAVTLTAAHLVDNGLLLCDPNGASRSYTTPTATLILASIRNAKVGTSFQLIIVNTADAAEVITLLAGTGVTVSLDATVGQNETGVFQCVVTNVSTPAVAVYGLGVLARA